MRRRSPILTILWPFFPVVLLVTASCGDFQDPASVSQEPSLSHPSISQAPQQQIDGSDSQPTPPPLENTVDPARLPISTGTAPTSPPPQVAVGEKHQTKSVTFEWNPSLSGNADGYKIKITTLSPLTQYAFETDQETRLTVDLPMGKSYFATVFAYNDAGQSPPADYIRFDLF
jgi:hypothetical protein